MYIPLAPAPKEILWHSGEFKLNSQGYISVDSLNLFPPVSIAKCAKLSTLEIMLGEYAHKNPQIIISKEDGLGKEGYSLSVSEQGINIRYSENNGAFYAMMTLNQLINSSYTVPCVEIKDSPQMKIRGYIWDIARNKIPTVATILKMIDRLAGLKINHLELYIEGVPFAYPSYPNMWQEGYVLKGEDMVTIDLYCKQRFIDFAPAHNTFGHMGEWLSRGYENLAMCPEGFFYTPWNCWFDTPQSLNPLKEESFEHVKGISDDLLRFFTSKNFNVCGDEVLELGIEETEKLCPEGQGKAYYDFLMKIYDYCASKGKTMMFWGDMILKYPEMLKMLPKDVIALNWGYEENEPTRESCEAFNCAGIPYCVCPGTNAWKTFTGKTNQMLANVKNALKNAADNGAVGMIMTDWGDNGHLQGLSTALPGIYYSASLAWGFKENKEMDLSKILNIHEFKDSSNIMGGLALKAGNYYLLESHYIYNGTVTEQLLFKALEEMDIQGLADRDHKHFDKIISYLESCQNELSKTEMHCEEKDLIKLEYSIGLQTVKLAQLCGHYKLSFKENDVSAQRKWLEAIRDGFENIIDRHKKMWAERNLYSRLDNSLEVFFEKIKNAQALLEQFPS